MKKIKLLSPIIAILLFTAITLSCSEDAWQEEEIAPATSIVFNVQLKGGDTRQPDIDTTALKTIYVEWQPYILTQHRDQIRSRFSDINGRIYLYDYRVCETNSNLEEWRVILDEHYYDQTPPPLVIIMDTEDEMLQAEHPGPNFTIQCDF